MLERAAGYVDDPTSRREARRWLVRIAAVFSTCWVVVVPLYNWWKSPPEQTGDGLLFLGIVAVVCIVNAGVVGGWLWRHLVERRGAPLTRRRGTVVGAVVGAVVGVVTYLTASFLVTPLIWVGEGSLAATVAGVANSIVSGGISLSTVFELVGGWLLLSVLTAYGAVLMTLGVPFVRSVLLGRTLGAVAESRRAQSGA